VSVASADTWLDEEDCWEAEVVDGDDAERENEGGNVGEVKGGESKGSSRSTIGVRFCQSKLEA